MPDGEDYRGFVPVTVLLPGQRIEGNAWKEAGQRLLEHIEGQKRQFLPIVEARIFDLSRPDEAPTMLPILAVNTTAITAIIPGDVVTPVHEKSARDAAGLRK